MVGNSDNSQYIGSLPPTSRVRFRLARRTRTTVSLLVIAPFAPCHQYTIQKPSLGSLNTNAFACTGTVRYPGFRGRPRPEYTGSPITTWMSYLVATTYRMPHYRTGAE